MDRKKIIEGQLAAMASRLAERRQEILRAWRVAVDSDPEVTTPASLPRSQFNDHIPRLLDAFEQKLRRWTKTESVGAEEQRKHDSASHGSQRWQQGYQLREVTREWGHLHLCLVEEVQSYAREGPGIEPEVAMMAWRALAELFSQGVSESTSQYFKLQQTEAAGHVRDMQETLAEAKDLDRRRNELFRQAAHDLRGNVGVVRNVTSGLTQLQVPEAMRDEFLRLLQKSVSSLHAMLDEALDLARLQAGHELRDIKRFDVAPLFEDLVASAQPMARERGLFLKAEGPRHLVVDGDAGKILRIAQNLMLNAMKYTSRGGVVMTWGDSRGNDAKRWMLSVQDTGPGLHVEPASPMADALKEATSESRQGEDPTAKAPGVAVAVPHPPITGEAPADSLSRERGEGIGLSIVKRLCELLNASVELESKAGVGTTFRVCLPRSYEQPGS